MTSKLRGNSEPLLDAGLLQNGVCRVARFDLAVDYEPTLREGTEPDLVITLPVPLEEASVGNQEFLSWGVKDEPIQEARRTLS